MYRFADACIIQFAKAPIAGTVKTRLLPTLGEQGCLELHKTLLETPLSNLANAGLAAYQLCVTKDPQSYFSKLIKDQPVSLTFQKGADLGERMSNAFAHALNNYDRVVMIGSDCPFIDEDYITQALEYLEQGNDAVFGPALDGGYVLIALNKPNEILFQGVPWGTDQVMAVTRQKLAQATLNWFELTPLPDIDIQQDLGFLTNWSRFAKFS